MRLQTQHSDKQSSLSSVIPCFCPLLRAPSGVVSTLASVRQRLTNPMFLFLLSLSLSPSLSPLLSLGSAQPLFLSFLLFSPPPPLCVSFKVNGACGRRSLGLSRALWECGVTWPRTGRTFWVGPGTHPLPVPFPWLLCTPCHRPDCTRTLTVWLALVAQRHRLHLHKGPAT